MRYGILALVLAIAIGSALAEDAEVKAIAGEMNSNDLEVRLAAFDKAAALATPEALDLVAQAYAKDPLDKVVIKAAWAIARIHAAQDGQESTQSKEDAKRWSKTWSKVADLLAKGMLDHREKIDIVMATIRAMAEMGDPKFVPVLSNDLWKVREKQVIQGRILALGCIRDKKSVDALMDVLYVVAEDYIRPYYPVLQLALRRLTGQTFDDRIEAKKWWKDNRETFRFVELDDKQREAQRRAFEKMWENADATGK